METEMNEHTRNLICSFCDLVFTRPFRLKRHLKNVHAHQQCDLNGGILKEFNTFSEFVTWKEEEENKTISKYVRQRGRKTLKNGDIVMSFHCCRSGTYKPKGKGLKSLKSQGSAKIGISCPAIIKVRQSTENVVVQYFPQHKNHENQLEHLRLSESVRATIAGRLKEGVSEKKILQDIKEEITVDSGRKMLIKKKDIHNIKRDFNINGYIKRHEVDAVSVKLHTHNEEIQEIYVNQNDILKETFDVLSCSSKSANNDGHESKKRKIESILALIDECEFTLEEESKIHRNLDSILNICYSRKKHYNKRIKMMESSTLNIKKEIEKQLGYFSTRRKRCTAGTLKNPTTEEANNIKKGLLLNSQEIVSINADFDHTYI